MQTKRKIGLTKRLNSVTNEILMCAEWRLNFMSWIPGVTVPQDVVSEIRFALAKVEVV